MTKKETIDIIRTNFFDKKEFLTDEHVVLQKLTQKDLLALYGMFVRVQQTALSNISTDPNP